MSSEPKFSAGDEVLFVDGVHWRAGVVVKVSTPIGRHMGKPPVSCDVRGLDGVSHRMPLNKIHPLHQKVIDGSRAAAICGWTSGRVERHDLMKSPRFLVDGAICHQTYDTLDVAEARAAYVATISPGRHITVYTPISSYICPVKKIEKTSYASTDPVETDDGTLCGGTP